MPKLMVKGKETDRQKAEKRFKEISLGDEVRTNKEYRRSCPLFPIIEGMVVKKEVLLELEKDRDAIPFIITVQTKSEQTIEVNAFWLEKIRLKK